jgi:hypothetical protein
LAHSLICDEDLRQRLESSSPCRGRSRMRWRPLRPISSRGRRRLISAATRRSRSSAARGALQPHPSSLRASRSSSSSLPRRSYGRGPKLLAPVLREPQSATVASIPAFQPQVARLLAAVCAPVAHREDRLAIAADIAGVNSSPS